MADAIAGAISTCGMLWLLLLPPLHSPLARAEWILMYRMVHQYSCHLDSGLLLAATHGKVGYPNHQYDVEYCIAHRTLLYMWDLRLMSLTAEVGGTTCTHE